MTTWLHFVGRRYYTLAAFVRKAERYGVTRRVSVGQLRQMSYGDRIVLAIRDGKSSLVFGCFHLETLSGLSEAAVAEIGRKFPAETVSPGGILVSRGCGAYIQGATVEVRASLSDLCEVLVGLENPGKPMVGGTFRDFGPVRLRDVPHRQGFRRFDWDGFKAAVAAWRPDGRHKYPVVRGQFYSPSGAFVPRRGGRVQEVMGYTPA